MTFKLCATCVKPCYPTEKVLLSDLWIHKHCIKCSVCFTTLSLNSVYVAPSPLPPFERTLFCSNDVPKIVHTSIVDSIALRTAMNAPNPGETPMGQFKKPKSKKSIRFKGLTLRSKAIKAGLEAPKLDIPGKRRDLVVGHAPGSPLDSWDIVHAMNVQSQISSPIQDHPAIHAQLTGSSLNQPRLSQEDSDDLHADEIAKESREKETIEVKSNMVKNLIRVFQLDTVDKVEITPSISQEIPDDPFVSLSSPMEIGSGQGEETDDESSDHTHRFSRYTDTLTRSIKPSHSLLSVNWQGTIRTVATLGSRRSTASTMSKRTPLQDLFINQGQAQEEVQSEDSTSTLGKESGNAVLEVKGSSGNGTVKETGVAAGTGTMKRGQKAVRLLESLLPMAAHLIPLPMDDDDVDDLKSVIEDGDGDDAGEMLVNDLEAQGLEIVMVFEEEPLPFATDTSVD